MKTELQRWVDSVHRAEVARSEADMCAREANKEQPKPIEIKGIKIAVIGVDIVNVYIADKQGGKEYVRYVSLSPDDMLNIGAYIKAVFGEKQVCPSE